MRGSCFLMAFLLRMRITLPHPFPDRHFRADILNSTGPGTSSAPTTIVWNVWNNPHGAGTNIRSSADRRFIRWSKRTEPDSSIHRLLRPIRHDGDSHANVRFRRSQTDRHLEHGDRPSAPLHQLKKRRGGTYLFVFGNRSDSHHFTLT